MAAPAVIIGDEPTVTVGMTAQARFFRLRKPGTIAVEEITRLCDNTGSAASREEFSKG